MQDKTPFGMPGLGGSLGQCAICGRNFLAEIILGVTVESFVLENFNNTFFCHVGCRPLLKEGMDLLNLPAGSPIREAYLKNHCPQN